VKKIYLLGLLLLGIGCFSLFAGEPSEKPKKSILQKAREKAHELVSKKQQVTSAAQAASSVSGAAGGETTRERVLKVLNIFDAKLNEYRQVAGMREIIDRLDALIQQARENPTEKYLDIINDTLASLITRADEDFALKMKSKYSVDFGMISLASDKVYEYFGFYIYPEDIPLSSIQIAIQEKQDHYNDSAGQLQRRYDHLQDQKAEIQRRIMKRNITPEEKLQQIRN
jgi:hypothetical protein